jgi:hypothetical protein
MTMGAMAWSSWRGMTLHYKNINTKKEQFKVQYRNGAKVVHFLESKMFFI